MAIPSESLRHAINPTLSPLRPSFDPQELSPPFLSDRFTRRAFSIGHLTPCHAPDLFRIEQESDYCLWKESAFFHEFELSFSSRYGLFLGSSRCREPVGFLFAHLVLDEVQVANLGLRRIYRGCGIGRAFCQKVFSDLERRGYRRISLEVHDSNVRARSLYRRIGFQVDGVRRGYYAERKEDAILMSRLACSHSG